MHKTFPLKNRQNDFTTLELITEIEQNIPKIEDELTNIIYRYSSNARYVPNSIVITSLESLGHLHYKLNYSFRWNVFNACLDIDSDELAQMSVNLTVSEGIMRFELIDDVPSCTSEEL